MNGLFVPDDYKQIKYDKITKVVSAIILNNSITITNDNILLLLIRILYHPSISEYKEVAHYEIMNIIERALKYDSSKRKEWTKKLCLSLLSDSNIKHFLSNIQASAQLIYMSLDNAQITYDFPPKVLEFLFNLYNSEEKLIDGLKQLFESLTKDDMGEFSNTVERQLKDVWIQKHTKSYPAPKIEPCLYKEKSMFKQFCGP
jgi:hypothetical protein